MVLTRVLMVGALAWPAVLGAALWDRTESPATERGAWSAIVYFAAGHVCHQQAERSFQTHGEKWPVCARCAGLYLAAPLGIVAFRRRRGANGARGLQPTHAFIIAAIPTVLTLAWEWAGLGTPSNTVRFISALPVGATIAWVLFTVTHQVD